jgi:hypothetical protein
LGIQKEKERLIRELERVKQALEEVLRRGKRQVAPFSKGVPKANSTPPGRKPDSNWPQSPSGPPLTNPDHEISFLVLMRCVTKGTAIERLKDFAMQKPEGENHPNSFFFAM